MMKKLFIILFLVTNIFAEIELVYKGKMDYNDAQKICQDIGTLPALYEINNVNCKIGYIWTKEGQDVISCSDGSVKYNSKITEINHVYCKYTLGDDIHKQTPHSIYKR